MDGFKSTINLTTWHVWFCSLFFLPLRFFSLAYSILFCFQNNSGHSLVYRCVKKALNFNTRTLFFVQKTVYRFLVRLEMVTGCYVFPLFLSYCCFKWKNTSDLSSNSRLRNVLGECISCIFGRVFIQQRVTQQLWWLRYIAISCGLFSILPHANSEKILTG